MKYLKQKEIKKRIYFENNDTKYFVFNCLKKNNTINLNERIFLKNLLNLKLNRNNSKTRINNRCLLSNRRRAIFRYFKLSRLEIRHQFLNGLIYNIRKSTW